MAGDASILEQIAARTRRRVGAQIIQTSIDDVAAAAYARLDEEKAAGPVATPAFETALRAPGMQFICEVKKASPSKGLIADDFDPVSIAREYAAAGAAAVSCLTEPYWFQGSDEHLAGIARSVALPVLRKDFVVDEYMVYQAKALGAGAVLLIAAILTDAQLAWFARIAADLGMSALVEAHDAEEVERAVACGARVVGVNNRDLATFAVDLTTSLRLRAHVPSDIVFVAESGIRSREDVGLLEAAGVDAVLVGETLMRSSDKRAMLDELRGRAV